MHRACFASFGLNCDLWGNPFHCLCFKLAVWHSTPLSLYVGCTNFVLLVNHRMELVFWENIATKMSENSQAILKEKVCILQWSKNELFNANRRCWLWVCCCNNSVRCSTASPSITATSLRSANVGGQQKPTTRAAAGPFFFSNPLNC